MIYLGKNQELGTWFLVGWYRTKEVSAISLSLLTMMSITPGVYIHEPRDAYDARRPPALGHSL